VGLTILKIWQAADNGNNLPAKIIHFNMPKFLKYIIRSYSIVFFNFKQDVQFFHPYCLIFMNELLLLCQLSPGAGNGTQQAERLSVRACGNRGTAPDMFLPPSQSEKKSNSGNRNGKIQNYF